jgi:hypothetical protein
MANQIQIQDELVATVNSAIARWSHRPSTQYSYPGQSGRTIQAAQRKASADLRKLGLTEQQVRFAILDAMDVAKLERIAEDAE